MPSINRHVPVNVNGSSGCTPNRRLAIQRAAANAPNSPATIRCGRRTPTQSPRDSGPRRLAIKSQLPSSKFRRTPRSPNSKACCQRRERPDQYRAQPLAGQRLSRHVLHRADADDDGAIVDGREFPPDRRRQRHRIGGGPDEELWLVDRKLLVAAVHSGWMSAPNPADRMSATTPTIVRHSIAPGVLGGRKYPYRSRLPIVNRFPIGSSPGQYRRAAVSFKSATSVPSAESASVQPRPLTIGTPMVAK